MKTRITRTGIRVSVLTLCLMTVIGCSQTTDAPNDDPDPVTAPTVISTVPLNLAADVAVNSNITAEFSEAMDPLTVTIASVSLTRGANAVSGEVTYASDTATFNPEENLLYSTVYTATISGSVTDLDGNDLGLDYVWTFTTEPAPDSTAPEVTSMSPYDTETGVSASVSITGIFSENLDPLTVTETTFTLMGGAGAVAGTVSATGNVATFLPSASLEGDTQYTATLTTGITDQAGNALTLAQTWSFSTGTATVPLGTAEAFVILTTSGITVGAGTTIDGDIGVSPNTSATLIGLALVPDGSGTFATSPAVTGRAYASDYLAPTPDMLIAAVNDMHAAYSDITERAGAVSLANGELGGRIITPGLYEWNAAVAINTDCTLNGGPDDVWIFRINGAMSMPTSITVHLTGGAVPDNIFWYTVGAVSLGAAAHLEGIVLASAAVSLGAGATVNGRLFADTFDTEGAGATVTQPAP